MKLTRKNVTTQTDLNRWAQQVSELFMSATKSMKEIKESRDV